MPLNQPAQALDQGPRSVQDARTWVADACRRLGREELIETSELAISELVTNALIHATGPITVRMRGTREHPRVEVFDGSHTPPVPNPRLTDEDELLSTIGRGLGIVATCSVAWGAEIDPQGKVVWFEPAADLSDGPDVDGDIYDPTLIGMPRQRLSDGQAILLRQLPVRSWVDFQRHYHELRRELRLLALAHEDDYPVAKSLSALFRRFDEELQAAQGIDALENAVETRADSVDVELLVPRSNADTAAQMIDLLELADAFCRAERLLSLATTPQQLEFQRWYLGEFVQQAQGGSPRPWAGLRTISSAS